MTRNKTIGIEDYCSGVMTEENIMQWKKSFNTLADRKRKADIYMDSATVPAEEKAKFFLTYAVEIIGPLHEYLRVFHELGMDPPDENGFSEVK